MQKNLAYLKDYLKAVEEKGKDIRKEVGVKLARWKKPPVGMVKINCDASVKRNGFIGVGYIIRNSAGDIIGSGFNRLQGDFDVATAEAMAIRSAMTFGLEHGVEACIVENDCEIVINRLAGCETVTATILCYLIAWN